MKAVIQRVSSASVSILGNKISSIDQGLLILIGIHKDDEQADIEYLVKKIAGLRIFSDSNGLMNLALNDVQGEILLVSQFTLYAVTRKGNRPSYIQAAKPEQAIPIYETFLVQLKELQPESKVVSGIFGADMQINLVNDGPVTIIIDSRNP